MIEEPLQFGKGGRLFGVLTRPDGNKNSAPAFVFLNAGLLHRAGPHRLHVRLARRLASHGFHSLRVDLGGLGDSLPPPGVNYPESVEVDFADIVDLLTAEIGPAPLTLVGLCSGADNAIRLASDSERVAGLVLMDPVCDTDEGFDARSGKFAARALATKATTPSRFVPALKRRIEALAHRDSGQQEAGASSADSLALRDIPDPDLVSRTFKAIRNRNGRVLSVFTSYALRYYNEPGQMGRVLGIDGYEEFASEIFWPHMRHTFPLETHRLQLLNAIEAWATA